MKPHSPDEDLQEEFYQVEDQAGTSIDSLATPSDLNSKGGNIMLRSALPPEHIENALRPPVWVVR